MNIRKTGRTRPSSGKGPGLEMPPDQPGWMGLMHMPGNMAKVWEARNPHSPPALMVPGHLLDAAPTVGVAHRGRGLGALGGACSQNYSPTCKGGLGVDSSSWLLRLRGQRSPAFLSVLRPEPGQSVQEPPPSPRASPRCWVLVNTTDRTQVVRFLGLNASRPQVYIALYGFCK